MTSLKIYFSAAILTLFMAEVTGHVIGGGLNTDFDLVGSERGLLRSFLSSARRLGRHRKQHKKPKAEKHFPGLVHTESWSSFDAAKSPFMRKKRQAQCVIPSYVAQLVLDRNRGLNATQLLDMTRPSTSYTPVSSDQPANMDCPSSVGSWWPAEETNLRSTCPWLFVEKDLGYDYFPRYVREAVCLCRTCVGANSMGCSVLRQPVTVFKRVECRDGVAVMTPQVISINTGCYCASSAAGQLAPSKATAATEK